MEEEGGATRSNGASRAGDDAAISEEEAAIYDRQIRLWGLDAQKRMRSGRVLLSRLNGIQTEVCKNLVLAGVGAVTIYDDATVTARDLSAQFFLDVADVGKKRGAAALENIKRLNPKVEVSWEYANIATVDEEDLKCFDVICVSECKLSTLVRLDNICRKNSISFYATDSFGLQAYIFTDLDGHQYAPYTLLSLVANLGILSLLFRDETKDPKKEQEEEKGGSEPSKKRQKLNDDEDGHQKEPTLLRLASPSLEEVLTRVNWSHTSLRRVSKLFFALQILLAWREEHDTFPLQSGQNEKEAHALLEAKNQALKKHGLKPDFLPDDTIQALARAVNADLSPVCAVVGGILGQQIIKVLTAKDEPFQNFFFYNALTASGTVEDIHGII